MIPYGRQEIDAEDIQAVVEVLKSPLITQGPKVEAFEQALASYCRAQYAVAVSSATAALHLACLALDVGAGDLVWTVPNTFVASANAARYCGAAVDFVDIDATTGNLCVQALAEKIAATQEQGKPLPKVLIPVHFAGASCNMKAIHALCAPLNIRIIEDASHAIGGKYEGEPVGGCRYSDMTVFRFHPVKIITTAEGGAITTNSGVLAERLAMLRSHGTTKIKARMQNTNTPQWYYEQHELGYNYRLSHLQAVLGLSQLSKIDRCIQQRNHLPERYSQALKGSPIGAVQVPARSYSSYHLFVIQVPAEQREPLFHRLRGANIGV